MVRSVMTVYIDTVVHNIRALKESCTHERVRERSESPNKEVEVKTLT